MEFQQRPSKSVASPADKLKAPHGLQKAGSFAARKGSMARGCWSEARS